MTRSDSLRDFPPVDFEVEVGPRVSQTFLGVHENCDRAAALHRLRDGGPNTHELIRGQLYHVFAERWIRFLIENDERSGPGEVAKVLMKEVMADHPHLTLPARERDALRAMAWNTAEGTFIDPSTVVACEDTFELEIGKWTVRGRIDLAELVTPTLLRITDYKTSFAMEDARDFAPGGIDKATGRAKWGGNFQTQLYAVVMAFGTIAGQPINIGAHVEQFHLLNVHPRYLREDGMAYREAWVTREQIADFRDDIELQLARLDENLRTGKWNPVVGTHCARCPSPRECPIPRHLRPESQLVDKSREEVEALARSWYFRDGDDKTLRRRFREWADQHDGYIALGPDLVLDFQHGVSEEIIDKERLRVEIEGRVQYGHDFDLADHVKVSQSTRFGPRRLSKEEAASYASEDD